MIEREAARTSGGTEHEAGLDDLKLEIWFRRRRGSLVFVEPGGGRTALADVPLKRLERAVEEGERSRRLAELLK